MMKKTKRALALILSVILTLGLTPLMSLTASAAYAVGPGNYYVMDLGYTVNAVKTFNMENPQALTNKSVVYSPAQNWSALGICDAGGAFKSGYALQLDLYTDNPDALNAGNGQVEITSSGTCDVNEMNVQANELNWQNGWVRRQVPLTDFRLNNSDSFNPMNVNYFRIYINLMDPRYDQIPITVKIVNVRVVDTGKTAPASADDPIGNDTLPVTVTGVTVSPTAADVAKGGTQIFAASVTGTNGFSQAVNWGIANRTSANTVISADGVLTVGKDETAQTLYVVASSADDGGKIAKATVTVKEAPVVTGVTVSPLAATVAKGGTQTFIVKVDGMNGYPQTVTWSVSGNKSNGTSVSEDGVLTVGLDETAVTLAVTATSTLDLSKNSTATVAVTDIPPTVDEVTVLPNPITIVKGDHHAFAATVTGTNNPPQTVVWGVTGNLSADTIMLAGTLYVGADETAAALTVTAASVIDPSKVGTAEVTVADPAPMVTGVRVSPLAATYRRGKDMTFTATVYGQYDYPQTVTWEVEGNTSADTSISEDGVLTVGADETAAVLAVTATSTYDISKFNTAIVVMAGDVNGDGKVDTTDARLVLQNIVGKAEFNDGQQMAADVSGDDTINTVDARLILQYIVGKISGF